MFSNLFLSVILSTIENYKHVGLLHIKYKIYQNIFFFILRNEDTPRIYHTWSIV